MSEELTDSTDRAMKLPDDGVLYQSTVFPVEEIEGGPWLSLGVWVTFGSTIYPLRIMRNCRSVLF